MLEWVKQHPYLSGGLVVGAFVLYLIYRGGSTAAAGGGAAGASYGPSDSLQAAELQAGTQVQGYQIQAGMAALTTNAELQSTQLTTAADVQKAFYAGEVSLQNTLSGQEVADAQTAAGLQLGLATIGGNLALSGRQAELITSPGSVVYGATAASMNLQAQQTAAQTAIDHAVASLPPAAGGPPPAPAAPVYYPTPGGAAQPVSASVSSAPISYGSYQPTTYAAPTFDNVLTPGSQLVPNFNVYSVGAWPDVNAVDANVQSQINFENADLAYQARSNHNRCLQDAALSIGQPNYSALVGACG